MALNLSALNAALTSPNQEPGGVSFALKGLKFDAKSDIQPVVDAINNCAELTYLNLEGNTLGVEASESLAKALEKHPELKRALWKDMFTGRMKTEIPKALEFLGKGLVIAGARLTELDLSDNAFGPIGVQGLAALLRSSSCYALEELRLNNNGLGIGGGKLLSEALLDCYNSSKKQGKPLALKVFIAGRNRLENEGAKALSNVFKTIGTLEEIAMPQNGIYHVGISALSQAFAVNKNLRILNLNDNTIGPKGAKAIASILPCLKNLNKINFGDCLLKTKGALALAEGLNNNCQALESLVLTFNEIQLPGALALIKAVAKSKINDLQLDGNQFGEQGTQEIKKQLTTIGKIAALGSMDEVESADEEEDENDDEQEEEDESEEEQDSQDEIQTTQTHNDTVEEISSTPLSCTITDFLKHSTIDKFIGLGPQRESMIIAEAMKNLDTNLEAYIDILMKVSSLCSTNKKELSAESLKCSEILYKQLFVWANKNEKLSLVNNTLLVYLGLIKSEDKKFKPNWNLDGCYKALHTILAQKLMPESTQGSMKIFIKLNSEKRPEELSANKKHLLEVLQ